MVSAPELDQISQFCLVNGASLDLVCVGGFAPSTAQLGR